MPNPILSWLKGDHLPRRRLEQRTQPVTEQKLYLYPDYLNPTVATDPDIYAAIRMGMLVHGPGASEMVYRAWHHEDTNSAVFACLTAIATAFPEAPAKVYLETEPSQPEEQPDHPLQQLLNAPNPYLSYESMWAYIQWAKHVNGNAYVRKIRSGVGGNVLELWPISPLRIVPVTTKEDAARGVFISHYAYTFDPSRDPERIPPEDIIHFRLVLDDKDHRLGTSPLARLVREVTGDEEAHNWQTSMLQNGGTVGMLIQVPETSSISQDQAEEMKARFEERFGGTNRGRTGVLMGGAKAEPYGFSPDQMDMKSLHRIPEERISAVLRVPAIIAGLGAGLDRSTYANFREAREMFTEQTLMPLYSFDAATMNMQLVPEFTSDPRIKVRFDVKHLRAFQEDEAERWKRLDAAVKTGWVRANEARSVVGLPQDMDDDELPGRAMLQALNQQPDVDDEQDALPRGEKQRALPVNQGALEQMPEILQALVELAAPGTTEDLEGYFDGQRRRIKRKIVTGT